MIIHIIYKIRTYIYIYVYKILQSGIHSTYVSASLSVIQPLTHDLPKYSTIYFPKKWTGRFYRYNFEESTNIKPPASYNLVRCLLSLHLKLSPSLRKTWIPIPRMFRTPHHFTWGHRRRESQGPGESQGKTANRLWQNTKWAAKLIRW